MIKKPLVIAFIICDKRFSYPQILEGVEAELQNGTTLRLKLQRNFNAIQNRMIRQLYYYFLEFQTVFKNFEKMALVILEKTPEDLLFLYREVGGLKAPQLPKVKRLVGVAKQSIRMTNALVMIRTEISTLLEQVQMDEKTVR